jgi:hypothetical protein
VSHLPNAVPELRERGAAMGATVVETPMPKLIGPDPSANTVIPAHRGTKTPVRMSRCPCKDELPVTNLEAGCENKCASPYIGERFVENSVGGKWLMGAVLRIPLTLSGRAQGAVGG